jgi:hypothetical protein
MIVCIEYLHPAGLSVAAEICRRYPASVKRRAEHIFLTPNFFIISEFFRILLFLRF